jgi:hypothetical protein
MAEAYAGRRCSKAVTFLSQQRNPPPRFLQATRARREPSNKLPPRPSVVISPPGVRPWKPAFWEKPIAQGAQHPERLDDHDVRRAKLLIRDDTGLRRGVAAIESLPVPAHVPAAPSK